MTHEAEKLVAAVERCKARMEYGLDHSNGKDLKILCEGIEALLGASQWRDISTAPKDGSMFIGWVSAVKCGEHDEGGYFEVDVSEPDFCVFKASEYGGYVDALSGPRADREQVTHWHPLPKSPED